MNEKSELHIKNAVYSIRDLLQDDELADRYRGGTGLVFRLTPDDYHRYCYVDDGMILLHRHIKGKLHTVRPIAVHTGKVFMQNTREYMLLETKHYGKVIHMEVGALLVGKIHNYKTEGIFTRAEEKGRFEFGGSTIVLLFEVGAAKFDTQFFDNTAAQMETIIQVGGHLEPMLA